MERFINEYWGSPLTLWWLVVSMCDLFVTTRHKRVSDAQFLHLRLSLKLGTPISEECWEPFQTSAMELYLRKYVGAIFARNSMFTVVLNTHLHSELLLKILFWIFFWKSQENMCERNILGITEQWYFKMACEVNKKLCFYGLILL